MTHVMNSLHMTYTLWVIFGGVQFCDFEVKNVIILMIAKVRKKYLAFELDITEILAGF